MDYSTDPRRHKICVSRSLIQELWVPVTPYVVWMKAAAPCSATPEHFWPISLMQAYTVLSPSKICNPEPSSTAVSCVPATDDDDLYYEPPSADRIPPKVVSHRTSWMNPSNDTVSSSTKNPKFTTERETKRGPTAQPTWKGVAITPNGRMCPRYKTHWRTSKSHLGGCRG